MNGSVLIVENEALVREAIEDILGADGLRTVSTGGGHEGIEAFKAQHKEIGLVILDMRLPGMSGPDVLRALRAIDPSLKVIVSSAYEEKEIKRGFSDEPISCILKKPFSADALLTTVRQVLDQ